MADEHNTATEDKIEFTDAQQTKVQSLIDAAVARVASKVRTEEGAKFTTLQTELATAKAEAAKAKTPTAKTEAGEEVAVLLAKIDEMKNASKATADAADRWKSEAQNAAEQAKAAKQETIGVRKEVAITNAASKINFVNTEVVATLTRSQIHVDAETGKFSVQREDGQPRLNAAMEPMSLDEFYNDFAAKNPYLVRGDVKSGSGGSENARSTLTSNGKYEVAQIFGPKSDSRLANKLALEDKAEYARLKVVARSNGLVA